MKYMRMVRVSTPTRSRIVRRMAKVRKVLEDAMTMTAQSVANAHTGR
jgi:hypothetical protein